ncbi:PfkB family carbohydrate kinase [Pseudomonas hunanensis]|uniref:PfkB family carbohydrate kinase n=1 Tax=Pseudomonas hunanensis TaxID=1247546 RepID=UPI0030DD870B
MITVVGGVYQERCMSPRWVEVYGSGGRAATALARMGAQVSLHAYADAHTEGVICQRAALEGFDVHLESIGQSVSFSYTHGLSTPSVFKPVVDQPPLQVRADWVVRFGMIEGDAVVDAEYAVYDPQSPVSPQRFSANGSKAKHLALILNHNEAEALYGNREPNVERLAAALSEMEKAEVVIIKRGPLGALVYTGGQSSTVPAYATSKVFKIGSGDNFVAHFAYNWLELHLPPHDAALNASRATAFYCQHQGFGTPKRLKDFQPAPLIISNAYRNGKRPKIYLAGPFFTLAQLWLVEEARNAFLSMGLGVFSPYHDVGHGPAAEVVQKDVDAIHECELMFVIGDGLDAGTIFEIGYARALNKPVIMYVENESEEDKKMMEGTHCVISNDFVTAIYQTSWEAVAV